MKIKKTINGDEYTFYVQPIYGEMFVNVRYFHTDEWIKCNLSEDLKWIFLPNDKFIFNNVNVNKLKINKYLRFDIMDYNNIC